MYPRTDILFRNDEGSGFVRIPYEYLLIRRLLLITHLAYHTDRGIRFSNVYRTSYYDDDRHVLMKKLMTMIRIWIRRMFGNRDLGVICVFESLPSFSV